VTNKAWKSALVIAAAAVLCGIVAVRAPQASSPTPQALSPTPQAASPKPRASSPTSGTIYLSTYKGTITILDEATEKVLGEIPSKIGIPVDVTFSDDRSKLYVQDASFEKVEIIDRVKRESIDTFTLTEGNAKTRIWGLQPDPHDKYLILVTKKYTLQGDRWQIGPPTLVQYDLATKKIARTIPWPKGEEREGAGVIFSPDGKLMYLMGEDVLIYETTEFKEVDRWDLSRPLEPGAGRVNFGGLDPFSDEPGFYTGLFTMQDQLQNRRIMGIGRVDLAKKKIDFHPIGPARGLGFSIAPDRKRAYGLFRDIGEYEFWTFDIENYRLLSRTPFRGRPRMTMRVNSAGNVLYIYTAGNTIDLYDTATFKLLRTITLDGDMTSFTLLPPPRRPPGKTSGFVFGIGAGPG
jgi:DNA-binding beta-propeller fold protein YncE